MHQKSFGGRALPGSARGAHSAPPDLLAGFKGGTLRQQGEGRNETGSGKGKGGR